MKNIFKSVISNSLSLFITTLLFSGIKISGGFMSFIYAGALLAIFAAILDPIVKIVTTPFNILTLGLLSFLTTLVALYILTLIYPSLTISAFTIEEGSLLGLEMSRIAFSQFLSFVVISATIYFLNKFINWAFSG